MKIYAKIYVLMLVGLFPMVLNAQISTGLLFGLSTGSVKIDKVDDQFSDVIKGNKIRGYEGGVFLKLKAGLIYARPSLLYNYRKGEVSFKTIGNENNPSQNAEFKQHKLQAPLIVGINILGPLAIEGGPTYNYQFSVTEDYGDKEIDIAPSGLGYRIGANLNLGQVFFNVSYEGMRFKGQDEERPDLREPYKLVFGLGVTIGGKEK